MTTRTADRKLRLLPDDEEGRLFEAASQSAPGTSYQVEVSRDGTAAVCQCPSYAVRERCWHTTEAMRLYGQRRIRDMKEERQMSTVESPDSALVPVGPGAEPPAPVQMGPLEPLPLQAARASLPSLYELRVYKELARAAESGSGVVMPKSIRTAGQAIMVMLQGRELGIGPMTSLKHIYPIDGSMVPSAQLQMALVLRNDPSARFIFKTRTAALCTVELHRAGHPVLTSSWSAEDSARARLSGKDNHKYYTTDMNTWMAVKRACRLGAPELLVFSSRTDELAMGAAVAESLGAEEEPGLLAEADPMDYDEPLASAAALEGEEEGDDDPWLEPGEEEPEPPAYDPATMLPGDDAQRAEWWEHLIAEMKAAGVSNKTMGGTIGGPLTLERAIGAARSMGFNVKELVGLAATLQ